MVIIVAIAEGALTRENVSTVLKAVHRTMLFIGCFIYLILRKIASEVFCIGIGIVEILKGWAKAYEDSSG